MTRPRRARIAAMVATAAVCMGVLIGNHGELPGSGGQSSADIVVMTWAPEHTKATNMPGMPAMARTYAKYLNDHGGIDGRRLKVLTCNERNDSIAAAKCAQRAAEVGAVAVVGSYSQHGSAFTSALESSGIPYIGGFGVTEDEFDSPLSYPVNGGLAALLTGSGRQLARECAQVSLIRPDTTAGDQFPVFLDSGLRAGGRRAATDLPAPEDATEYTEIASRAIGDDAHGRCVAAVLGDATATFFDSFRRQTTPAPRARIASVLGSVEQSLIDSTGGPDSPLEGALVSGWYPPVSDPRWGTMKAVINKYAFDDNNIDADDPGVQTTWIAYTVFDKVANAVMAADGTITARSLKLAMDRAHGISTGGLTPALGWRSQDLVSVPDYPRLVNGKVTYQVVRNGRLVAASKGFKDIVPTLERYGDKY
jgi:ABC-type branched-subunit amino acid transport system substrate-binding protein